jgi:hypothetical protein
VTRVSPQNAGPNFVSSKRIESRRIHEEPHSRSPASEHDSESDYEHEHEHDRAQRLPGLRSDRGAIIVVTDR